MQGYRLTRSHLALIERMCYTESCPFEAGCLRATADYWPSMILCTTAFARAAQLKG